MLTGKFIVLTVAQEPFRPIAINIGKIIAFYPMVARDKENKKSASGIESPQYKVALGCELIYATDNERSTGSVCVRESFMDVCTMIEQSGLDPQIVTMVQGWGEFMLAHQSMEGAISVGDRAAFERNLNLPKAN